MSNIAMTPAARVALAMKVPLVAALHPELVSDDLTAGVQARIDGLAGNGAGGTHTAALTALLELAGYLALTPVLDATEHAISHAVALQLLAPAPAGATVRCVGSLDRRGHRLAFLTAVATIGDDVIARAQLTKSIVVLTPAT